MPCGAVRGGTERGSREDSRGSLRSSLGRYRSLVAVLTSPCFVLAAGVLAVFTVDQFSAIYKRAGGALAVSSVDSQSVIYKPGAAKISLVTNILAWNGPF